MPITKFTLDYPRIKSYFIMPIGYEQTSIGHGINHAGDLGVRLTKISLLMSYLSTHLEASIEDEIARIMGKDEKVTITQKTKRHTIYWIPNLFIHVEN